MGIPFALVASSLLFPSINSVLTLITGSICGVILLILPPIFYMKAYKNRPPTEEKDNRMKFLLASILIGCAVPIGLFGFYTSLYQLIKGE